MAELPQDLEVADAPAGYDATDSDPAATLTLPAGESAADHGATLTGDVEDEDISGAREHSGPPADDLADARQQVEEALLGDEPADWVPSPPPEDPYDDEAEYDPDEEEPAAKDAVRPEPPEQGIDFQALQTRIEAGKAAGGNVYKLDELRDLIEAARQGQDMENQTVPAGVFMGLLEQALDGSFQGAQRTAALRTDVAETLVSLANHTEPVAQPETPVIPPQPTGEQVTA